MKVLTTTEINELIINAFEAGYSAGMDAADELLHVEDSASYLKSVLIELGEM